MEYANKENEMTQIRHRIKNVILWETEGNFGFSILTKNGNVAFPINQYTEYRLQRFLPHYYKQILAKIKWTEEELKALLVNKYCYGKSIEYIMKDGRTLLTLNLI